MARRPGGTGAFQRSRPAPGRNRRSLAFEEAAQLFRARRVPQLAQRLRLDLANALARDVELLADLFQRVVGVHLDAEAHPQHLRLARRQRVEDVLADIAQARVDRGVGRRHRRLVLDEVAQMRIVVVADRRFHRDRLLADLAVSYTHLTLPTIYSV